LASFSILLFYSTVCFHFAEQINDDDDDEDGNLPYDKTLQQPKIMQMNGNFFKDVTYQTECQSGLIFVSPCMFTNKTRCMAVERSM